MKEKGDTSRLWLFALCVLFVAHAAVAGGMSSLTVGGFLDNNPHPAVRVAGSGAVEVVYSGSWFGSGTCVLYVDGEQVATSSGGNAVYPISFPVDAGRTYCLMLKSGDEEMTRFVTLFPSAGFACSLHSLTLEGRFLDSRPEGTTRRLLSDGKMDITWSGLWNDAADRAVVTLYRGRGTGGESLGEIVAQSEGGTEGTYPLLGNTLPLGVYTLTHYDGVETLVAYVSRGSDGIVVSFK